MMNSQSLLDFHCGLFAAFYLVVGLALWLYHRETKGAIALALVSAAAGLAHIFSFLINGLAPEANNLQLGLAAYYTWAPPTLMLCIKEAISPGWLTWEKWARYVSPFMVGTLICLFTESLYTLYILIGLDVFATVWSTSILRKGIDQREKLVKEFFSEVETFGHGWVKGFLYFQIATSLCLFFLNLNINPELIILWNYVQAVFWLYFLLKCRQQRYYSTQIPDDFKKDFDELDEIIDNKSIKINESTTSSETTEEGNTEPTMDKTMISQDTLDYIEKRLKNLEEEKRFTDETLNLTSLAQAVGTNRTYMSVYFRIKNTTFWDYINRKRCEYAIDLMRIHQNITMAELSHMCGYKTENCFRSSFTTLYGKTPFVYKREIKAKREE